MLFRTSLAAVGVALALAGCEGATPVEDREPDTAPEFSREVADQTYKALQQIEPLVLPRASGGNDDLSYSLSAPPPGLEFDSRSRTLSGTPHLVANDEKAYRMTYRVEDADNNRSSRDADTLEFTITIQPDTILEKVVSSVAVGAAGGGLKYAALPTPSGGPAISVDGSSTIVAGGAFFLDVVSASGAALDTLLVSVAGEQSGYYEIDLESAASSYRLVGLVPYDLDPTRGSLNLCVTAVYAIDRAGAAECRNLEIADVVSGDVQVTLSWDADSNLDLEVLGPDGALVDRGTVSRGADRVTDANAGCDDPNDAGGDDLRNEYVARTAGSALPGTYTVQVNYRSSCGVPETDYVLRVNNGGAVSDVSGTLTVPGRLGSDVVTFMVAGATPPPAIEDGISLTYRGSGDQVFVLNPEGEILDTTPVTLRLGSTSAEVYLVATNTAHHPMAPRVERLDGVSAAVHGSGQAAAAGAAQRRVAARTAVPERAWVSTFNNESALPPAGSCGQQQSRSTTTRVGDRHTFRDFDDAAGAWVDIPATARKVVVDSNTRLTVWFADQDWQTCTDCVRQEVDAIADRLLNPAERNDIYFLVTAIFGAPWGPHERSCLIAPESAGDLHILLYDIDGDGVPAAADEPRTLGFFAAKDNYLRNSSDPLIDSSNERLLFYLDAPLLARADGSTWEESDLWPRRMIVTLAHELQHMIHFFQKRVSQDAGSEAWLNEMASSVAEDLIVGKLEPPIAGMDGPRGVIHDNPTAGSPRNPSGLLPLYNLHNDIRVTAWDGERRNAAVNYALGAYLARTYGGAALFGAIVQSEHAGVAAIATTLRNQGHTISFGDVLASWAVANLLSDNTGADHPYRYNPGTWSTSSAGGVTFLLGSINLYHYRHAADSIEQEGPFLYSLDGFNQRTQPPHSNMYATLGHNTGTVRLRVERGQRTTASR